jgi:hypothetical protein
MEAKISSETFVTIHKTAYATFQETTVFNLCSLIAQEVSRRPPSLGNVGFVVHDVALGQVFCKYFGFSYQFSSHRLLHTHLSFEAGTRNQLVADVPSGLSLTDTHKIKKINLLLVHLSTIPDI